MARFADEFRGATQRGINPPQVPDFPRPLSPRPLRPPTPQRRSYGRGFLGTFMNLARQVIPSTRKELERRLRSKLEIEREFEDEGTGARAGASGGTFRDSVINTSPQPSLVGDPKIVLGSPDNLTPSLIGDNIVPYDVANSAQQDIAARQAPPFRRSEEAQKLVAGRNLQVPNVPISRPEAPKGSASKIAKGFTQTALQDLMPEDVEAADEAKKGRLVFDTSTGKWRKV